jgi:hypothetical protein
MADVNSTLPVTDSADGTAVPGAVAANSTLIGGQFNTVLPTLTNTQQAAVQVDNHGRLLISSFNNLDNTGAGTITALNGAIMAITNGCGAVTFNVTGVWVATLTIQATVDGVNWSTVNGSIVATDQTVQFFSTNAFVVVPCGSFAQVRLIATAFTSGTINVAWNAGAGENVTPVFNNVAAAFNAQVVGNVASGSADSGNGVKVSAVYNSVLPVLTTGQRADLQTDINGRLITTASTTYITYAACTNGLVLAAAPTDVVTITGSATKKVSITHVRVSGNVTGGGTAIVLLIKRSSADTLGTSTTLTNVPYDSVMAAPTAVVKSYTANPTLGTTVGTLRSVLCLFPSPAPSNAQSAVNYPADLIFGAAEAAPIVLHGIAEQLAVNFNGTTLAGSSMAIDIEWTEI